MCLGHKLWDVIFGFSPHCSQRSSSLYIFILVVIHVSLCCTLCPRKTELRWVSYMNIHTKIWFPPLPLTLFCLSYQKNCFLASGPQEHFWAPMTPYWVYILQMALHAIHLGVKFRIFEPLWLHIECISFTWLFMPSILELNFAFLSPFDSILSVYPSQGSSCHPSWS